QKARGIELPAVGLLNMGSESTKGTAELRLAHQLLSKFPSPPFHFLGNIEGNRAFQGDVDVLVTNGFTGNIFLKTSEGIANFLLEQLFTHIPKTTLEPHLASLKNQLHYAEYPGALLAGVQGTVIKCHGYSTPKSFVSAINGIIRLL
ncbi:MAG TPA: phosphate acyltransferase, partial [Parachlamydiales bacterium]|nr:phosphate acyltransferase [Parachlamydiales bacterium]